MVGRPSHNRGWNDQQMNSIVAFAVEHIGDRLLQEGTTADDMITEWSQYQLAATSLTPEQQQVTSGEWTRFDVDLLNKFHSCWAPGSAATGATLLLW